jgi:glycosyltransferase involved in cell wall biosynthesis
MLGQTYENLEVIISDNASTDNTGTICLEYAARDQRVQYHRNPIIPSPMPNFRRVCELASGDYFMWAAADDVRPATTIEHCVAALLRNSSAVIAHSPVLVKLEGQVDLVQRANGVYLADWKVAERVRAFTKGIRHQGWCTACTDDALSRKGRSGLALGRTISCVCRGVFWAPWNT